VERLFSHVRWLIIACFTKPAGLTGNFLRLMQPVVNMHCLSIVDMQTWQGLIVLNQAWVVKTLPMDCSNEYPITIDLAWRSNFIRLI
jgi:hypothetical protein